MCTSQRLKQMIITTIATKTMTPEKNIQENYSSLTVIVHTPHFYVSNFFHFCSFFSLLSLLKYDVVNARDFSLVWSGKDKWYIYTKRVKEKNQQKKIHDSWCYSYFIIEIYSNFPIELTSSQNAHENGNKLRFK